MSDPELDAALDSVAKGPLDEGRRRVLADLLLERGDPRGEFLLLQFLISANQGSGAVWQRAAELWRRHRHQWMAGLDKHFSELVIENGFPVSARVNPNLPPETRQKLLASPLLATVRHLSAHCDGEVLIEAAREPRFVALESLLLSSLSSFEAVCDRGVAGRLRKLRLTFPPTPDDFARLIASPAMSALRHLIFQMPRRGGVENGLRVLTNHAPLTHLELAGEVLGSTASFSTVVALWRKTKWSRVSAAGSFELAREPDGSELTLMNQTTEALLRLVALVPPEVTKVRLMPARTGLGEEGRGALLTAWARFNPSLL